MGDPRERDRAALADDLVNGYVSREAAKVQYGLSDSDIAAIIGKSPA
jgi:N-methylhydantoinase B/oxoprolinase/acetone carboxylase alpha subunit